MGFVMSKSDSSLFIRKGQDGLISILLYVDDFVIAKADVDEIDRVKSQLAASFDMKDLRDLHPQDRSDSHPRRHTDQPTTLRDEYALQIRDGRL